ncbi:hypothetical protein [Bacillus cereus group sp. TH150LC]|uniref:hypothetical protein n=1 Tax=Bacillus cereus group sp. TH150LC TaxID=3018061 RepID=UPI0022DF80E3|nr:hypothetical protein [Bacillus cereus group sp. TH150LC]MDA1657935.1 hypothetical protein [Bacillus cereus group sp. TH150LC]
MSEELRGIGKFDFNTTESLEGDFLIDLDVHNPWDKSKNLIIGKFNGIISDEIGNGDLFFPWNFKGIGVNGQEITANALALVGISERPVPREYDCRFEISQLTIGEYQECEYFEFWIPNFIIGFDQVSEHSPGRMVRDKSYLNLEFRQENFSIEFTGVNGLGSNYQEILNRKEDFISVKVIIKKENGTISYDLATELMDILLDLCSIAYGQKIAWTNIFGYNNNCEVFKSIRKLSPGVLNSIRPLIDVRFPNHLTHFIQTCFPAYSAFDAETKISLKKLTEGIHLATANLKFPIPFIIIGSAIEEFVQNELDDVDVNYIQRADRRRIYRTFKALMQEHVNDLLSEEDRIELLNDQTLHQKWSALLQRNLRIRITKLLEEFQIEFNVDHVGLFVQKRNNAAHGSYEYSSSDYIIWSQMVALLEKVLLKKIQYEGEYIDFSTSPPRSKVLTIHEA